jgi:PHP family Zn ribbon phosphoesterase
MRYCIDLHNHSCLSPCGENALLPSILALEASEKGVDILALSDHNSTRNLVAFEEAAQIVGITPIFGIEITTIEEVHLLSLFEHLEQALEFGKLIDTSLIKYKNDPSLFGDQLVVDVMGNIIDRVEHMLYGPSKLSFETLIHEILLHDGLAIPAHIDRPSNSVLANLGFLPELPYSALEMMRPPVLPSDSNYAIVQGSDAHHISHIARRSCYIEAQSASFDGIKKALSERHIYYRS